MIKVNSVKINKYKSINNAELNLDQKITTLVGVNESGKSAILEAIAKTGSVDEEYCFDIKQDYPRSELREFQKSSRENGYPIVVTLKGVISDELLLQIQEDLGEKALPEKGITWGVDYQNVTYFLRIPFDFESYLNGQIVVFEVTDSEDINRIMTITTACENLDGLYENMKSENGKELIDNIRNKVSTCKWVAWNDRISQYLVEKWICPNLPKFWYFDEYESLPPTVNLTAVASEESTILTASKAFVELTNFENNDIVLLDNDDIELYINELESTAKELTDQFLEYWNTENKIEFKFQVERGNGEPILNIRVRNHNDWVSIPLDKRSKGFYWFFSFLVWFSSIQNDEASNYVLLLDEPGLNLHASAQSDLLRFMENLAEKHQIIYTTHSPFMINPLRLDRIRTVVQTKVGTTVSENIQDKDSNTLFPLQAALGYDIAQNLFISKNNLLVEGPADLLYLLTMSSILEIKERTCLKQGITIVPVGGLDKVPSFVSLFRGNKLNLVCLLDTFRDAKGKQRMDELVRNKIIRAKNIVFYHEFTSEGKGYADIEDLFTKEEYVKVFNCAFSEHPDINIDDLDGRVQNIIQQINKYLKIDRFNHYRPAMELSKIGSDPSFYSEETLARFERLFTSVNSLFD